MRGPDDRQDRSPDRPAAAPDCPTGSLNDARLHRSRVGWWMSEFKSQIEQTDGGRMEGDRESQEADDRPGGISANMARALLSRHSHLMHVLPYLIGLVAQ